MKRYELAKSQGLNWQVVLIQDLETDIKVLTLESVKAGEDYGTTNKKVMRLINDAVRELESLELKAMVKNNMPNFASRIYLRWLSIYGNNYLGNAVLLALTMKGANVPVKVQEKLKSLPKVNPLSNLAYNRATANMVYEKNLDKEIISRINAVFDAQAKEDYSERHSLRAGAERQVRYEWQRKQLDDLMNSGIDLVWINTHANCSERCQEWQGKLYSISGKSGTIDGIEYQPLSNATDRYETTKAGKTYINGTLTGFNCRHTTTPYKKGNKPTHIPESVIEKERAIETRQRELERYVRKYESRALGWKADGNKALYSKYRDLTKKWTEEYISFSKKNKVPFYPSRLKI